MSTSLTLPCARCGRPVQVRVGDELPEGLGGGAGPMRCDRCSVSSSHFDVQTGGGAERLERSTVIMRLRAGVIAPHDFISEPGGRPQPIGAHPAFRALFLPGNPDFLGLQEAAPRPVEGWFARTFKRRSRPERAAPEPTAPVQAAPARGAPARSAPARAAPVSRSAPPRRRSSALPLAVVAVMLVGGGVAVAAVPELRALVLPFLESLLPGSAVPAGSQAAPPPAAVPAANPAPASVPVAAPPPPAPAEIDALVARIGVVDTPRNLLLARAGAAYHRGDRKGLDDALREAERAVARLPHDPECLALLAEVLAVRGESPGLMAEALGRAKAVAADRPAVMTAGAAVAWVQGESEAAFVLASQCFTRFPAALGCEEWKLRTTPDGAPVAERLVAWDALAARWKDNRRIVRSAALFAAGAGSPDAAVRLEALRRTIRGDVELAGALARVKQQSGDEGGAASLVRTLGADAPPDVVVALAASAMARGEASAASAFLRLLATTELADRALSIRASELRAQATVYPLREAPMDPGTRARTAEAVDALLKLDAGNPAAMQVRLLAAAISATPGAGLAMEWERVQADRVHGRDLARLWLAKAASDLARGAARDAESALEEAQRADPHLPEVYLWRARLALSGQDAPSAFAALRGAIHGVDGTDERKPPVGRLLQVPCDVALLVQDMDTLVGANAAQKIDLDTSIAVLAWLSGETDGALTTASVLAERSAAPDMLALVARLRLSRGDAAGALVMAEKAAAAAPSTPAWQLLRARALAALGRYHEVLSALAVVKAAGAGNAFVLTTEAEARAATADAEGALVAAQAAVTADPDDLAAAKLLAKLSGRR